MIPNNKTKWLRVGLLCLVLWPAHAAAQGGKDDAAIYKALDRFGIAIEAKTKSMNIAGDSELFAQLDLFGTVFERVRTYYVDEVDVSAVIDAAIRGMNEVSGSGKDVTAAQLIEGSIKGMLSSLDRHSVYLNRKTYEARRDRTKSVVRARKEGRVGYVRIAGFNKQTVAGLESALKAFKKDLGDRWQGLVLDLRDNPGGLLDVAVAVADAFLEDGEIVTLHWRYKNKIKRFDATLGDLTGGLPLAVLINGASGSGSEIVAGALQHHRRATVLGTRSAGRGMMRTYIPIGKRGVLRLTTSRVYTASGSALQGEGIQPNIEVKPTGTNGKKLGEKSPDAKDYLLSQALDLLTKGPNDR